MAVYVKREPIMREILLSDLTEDQKHDLIQVIWKADQIEITKCEDCLYRDGKTPGQPNIICWNMHEDDFCSYGEGKNDADTK